MKKAYLASISLLFLMALLLNVNSVTSESYTKSPDLNGDGKVDMKDISTLAQILDSSPGEPDWNPRYDLNDDNRINLADKIFVINSFGVFSETVSSFGMHSDNWSWEEKNMVYDGSIELPGIFVSRQGMIQDIPSLKEKQPGKKIIIYRNLRKVDRTKTEGWADNKNWRIAEYEFARRNNIICKNSWGNDVYSTSYGRDYLLADIGNPKWQQFLADWVKFYIDNYEIDGVYLDNGLFVHENEIYWGVSAKPINPRTGTFYTNKEVSRYLVQFYKKLRETIGDDKLIICNGIFNGRSFFSSKEEYMDILDTDLIDGFISEGIFGGTSFWGEERWLDSVKFIKWVQENWLEKGKLFVANLNEHSPNVQTKLSRVWVGFEKGYSLKESMTYHFASTLLGIKTDPYKLNYFSSRGYWYVPFVEGLYSLDLGEPTGQMYQRDGTHVYVRAFEKGLVLVNPTESTHLIPLSGSYHTLEGGIISGSYHVGSFEGVILLNAE